MSKNNIQKAWEFRRDGRVYAEGERSTPSRTIELRILQGMILKWEHGMVENGDWWSSHTIPTSRNALEYRTASAHLQGFTGQLQPRVVCFPAIAGKTWTPMG